MILGLVAAFALVVVIMAGTWWAMERYAEWEGDER